VTSPTGIREIDKQCGTSIGDQLIAAIERHLATTPRARRTAGGPAAAAGSRG